jgi:hypothetical protein
MSNLDNEVALNLTILQHSLSDVQNSIRAYDVKAQIVSIGFIFSLGLIITIGESAPQYQNYSVVYVLISWVLGVLPIAMFGYVLYPSRSIAPKLGTSVKTLQRSYYLIDNRFATLDDYLNAFDQSDWKVELAYEIQKNSLLRDLKRKRFVWGLTLAGISFSLMFMLQLFRSEGFVI